MITEIHTVCLRRERSKAFNKWKRKADCQGTHCCPVGWSWENTQQHLGVTSWWQLPESLLVSFCLRRLFYLLVITPSQFCCWLCNTFQLRSPQARVCTPPLVLSGLLLCFPFSSHQIMSLPFLPTCDTFTCSFLTSVHQVFVCVFVCFFCLISKSHDVFCRK